MWKYRAEWSSASVKIMLVTCVMEDDHDFLYDYQYINDTDRNIYQVYATYYEGSAVRLVEPNKIWKELNE